MAIEPDFQELMIDTITVERLDKRDAYGKPLYLAPEQFRARVVERTELVRTAPDAQERVARGRIYLFGAPNLHTEDRVTLPDASQPVIINIEKFPDEKGDHHEVIIYG